MIGKPVKHPTTADPRESLRGLVCRALGTDGIPHSFRILKLVGALYPNNVSIAEDHELDFDELARLTKIDRAELDARRYQSLDNKRWAFFDMPVRSGGIETQTRRFSPASLHTTPVIRALWELRDLPFCVESGEILLDECRCGYRQRFERLNKVHRCDDCGRPLENTPTTTVTDDMRTALTLPALLASPLEADRSSARDMLPPELKDTDRGRVFATIMQIRRALAGPSDDVQEDLSALHSACLAVIGGATVLAKLKPHAKTTDAAWLSAVQAHDALRCSTIGNLVQLFSNPRPIGRLMGPQPTKALKAAEVVERGKLIGIRPAGELANVTPETLIAARGKHLSIHDRVRGARTVPVFNPEELLAFRIAYGARRDIRSVGYRLGLPDRGVEQLAMTSKSGMPIDEDTDFDTPLLPSNAPSLPGEPFHFYDADVSNLEAALLSARSIGTVDDQTPLIRAVYAMCGGTKPWGAILAGLLDGLLPFDLDDEVEAPLIHRILVGPSSLRSIAALRTPASLGPRMRVGMTREEALSTLNAGAQDDCLDGLPRVGRNPLAFDAVKVEERSGQAIAIAEIAWRTGKHPMTVSKWLQTLDPPIVSKRMWNRRFVEARITELGSDLLDHHLNDCQPFLYITPTESRPLPTSA